MAAIRCNSVAIALAGRTILSEVDLDIGDGELVGVLGPNGAGKTTLLRAILGLVPLAAGQMTVLGATPRKGNAAIGYMPQSRALADAGRLRGRDIVGMAARGERWGLPWSGRDAHREVDWALSCVGARELAERPLGALSGGERQRLLLAQALLGRPRLLLLDEPLVNLDPRHQANMVSLIRAVQQELRLAVLFCTHELNPVLGALDRALYLGNGRAVLGTVKEVVTGPVLSRLYDAPIEVIEIGGRIFVMSGNQELDHCDHGHHAGADHAPV